MATMTIRAADSAQALDEVMRCLGPDALILSTRQHKGQVEIVAAPAGGVPQPTPPMPETPPASAGFSAHLLRRLAGGQTGLQVLPPHLPGRVVLAGPPGSGRSTLAARLAAEALRTPGAARPSLIAPRPDVLAAPGRLAGYARLMGLVPHRPVWPVEGAARFAPPAADETQIIDLSDMPPLDPARLAGLCARSDSTLWLVLPTGLHPDLLDRLCGQFAGMAGHVVLTRTDLCSPTTQDLETPRRHGLPVFLLAGGTGLLDALKPGPDKDMTRVPADAPLVTPQAHPEELPDAATRLS
jgi:flagellar biosynthesis GTPase FlhF